LSLEEELGGRQKLNLFYPLKCCKATGDLQATHVDKYPSVLCADPGLSPFALITDTRAGQKKQRIIGPVDSGDRGGLT
jgi:hypothetical protein